MQAFEHPKKTRVSILFEDIQIDELWEHNWSLVYDKTKPLLRSNARLTYFGALHAKIEYLKCDISRRFKNCPLFMSLAKKIIEKYCRISLMK